MTEAMKTLEALRNIDFSGCAEGVYDSINWGPIEKAVSEYGALSHIADMAMLQVSSNPESDENHDLDAAICNLENVRANDGTGDTGEPR